MTGDLNPWFDVFWEATSMKIRKSILFGLAILAIGSVVASDSVGAVAVGSSNLIKTLDYSDTFTHTGSFGDRPKGVAFAGNGLLVENTYGNPAATWSDVLGIATSSTIEEIEDSLAGSDTGIGRNDDAWPDYGFEYGLRDRFLVQYDTMLPTTGGRVDIGIGSVKGIGNGTIVDEGELTVFFRTDDHTTWTPGISVYDGLSCKETDVQITTGLTEADLNKWHNFAVLFDMTERTLDFFIDEGYRGSVDLDTVTEHNLDTFAMSNAYVNIGHHVAPSYFDNAQVGEPELGIVPPKVPGDTDNDGDVDEADAQILASNWGATVTSGDVTKGDFNADGVVNVADAAILAANWTDTPPESHGNAVPEPSMLLLLASLLPMFAILRRRR
jgi:hypothetical protein